MLGQLNIDVANLSEMVVNLGPGFVDGAGGPLAVTAGFYQIGDTLTSPLDKGIDLKNGFNKYGMLPLGLPQAGQSYDELKAAAGPMLDKLGIDSNIIADDIVSSEEFARVVATRGFQELEKTGLTIGEISPETHPEAFANAEKFLKINGIDPAQNPELVVGAAGFEVGVNTAIQEFQTKGTVAGMRLPGAEVPGVKNDALGFGN